MQAIQIILVSTVLFYGKVRVAPIFALVSSPTSVPAITSSMNKPNDSPLIGKHPTLVRFQNCTHHHSQFKNVDLSSKNAPIANTDSSQISSKPSININNLANGLMDDTDSLDNAKQNTKDIYVNVLLLLLYKIHNWLTSNVDLNAISSYLGFPPQTIDLINAALTELLYHHRKGHINISNLANAFFYSCDIEHMRDHNTHDEINVKNKFQTFLSKFGFKNQLLENLKNLKESDLVTSLKNFINSLSCKNIPSYSVTIPLMKNRTFVNESKNKTVNKLKARFIVEYQENQAESYEKETDGDKVTKNHVNLIRKLIPDIFGFAYNHFELLSKLREYELNDVEETQAVKRFSGFLKNFMEIFITRYFEFKNEDNQPFLNAMYPLIDFLNPEEAPEKQTISILDYRNMDETFNTHMWTLMNNALEKLLAECGDESIDQWKKNRSLKIDYPSKNLTKDKLINLMNGNTDDAYDILGVFVSDFVHGVELYKKYELDLSKWPEFIY